MKVFVCLFLLPLITYSVEEVNNGKFQIKRGLDHRSNIALLSNLNLVAPSPTPSILNVNTVTQGPIPVSINTANLALGNANAVQTGLQFAYAPAYTAVTQNQEVINTPYPNTILQQNQQLINPQPLENNLIYLSPDRPQSPTVQNIIQPSFSVAADPNANLQANVVNPNVFQNYAPSNLLEVQQQYPTQLIREVKVPQPYPVHITRTVQVPVEVKVPVEVPKPYAVRVPHPVPVPVHIRVPVTVEKPYAVQVTKTIAVPVEKPVYIKVPQPIQVPVAQPYPVPVPQPVQVQIPFVVRLPEGQGPVQAPQAPNLVGTTFATVLPDQPGLPALNNPLQPNLVGATFATVLPEQPALSGLNAPAPLQQNLVGPAFATVLPDTTSSAINQGSPNNCNTCIGNKNVSTTLAPGKKPVTPIIGNGLLPPPPPSNLNAKPKIDSGLLNSYVSSKEGGVYRRSTGYQTLEYKRTW